MTSGRVQRDFLRYDRHLCAGKFGGFCIVQAKRNEHVFCVEIEVRLGSDGAFAMSKPCIRLELRRGLVVE